MSRWICNCFGRSFLVASAQNLRVVSLQPNGMLELSN